MPRVIYSKKKGLDSKSGSGLEFQGDVTFLDEVACIASLCSGNTTVTAAATNGTQLDGGVVQTVTAGSADHRVQMPLAAGAGQLMIIRNVHGSNAVDIRNNANDADIVNPLSAGKTAICISTAAGDNWVGSAVD